LEKIQRKDYDGLEELIKHGIVDVNMQVNSLGMTPLHVTCSMISDKTQWMIHILLKHKADPNIQDIHGRTCLHFAATLGNVSALTFILRFFNISGQQTKFPDRFSVQLNLRTIGGETALFKAV
jgi:ankyrin repeat protein